MNLTELKVIGVSSAETTAAYEKGILVGTGEVKCRKINTDGLALPASPGVLLAKPGSVHTQVLAWGCF